MENIEEELGFKNKVFDFFEIDELEDLEGCTSALLNSSIIKKLSKDKARYEELINIDIMSIVSKYNKGDFKALDDEEVDIFLELIPELLDIANIVLSMKRLQFYGKKLWELISYCKRNGVNVDDDYVPFDCVKLGMIKEAYAMAYYMHNDGLIYRLFDYSLKYSLLVKQIKARRELSNILEINSGNSEQLNELLNKNEPWSRGAIEIRKYDKDRLFDTIRKEGSEKLVALIDSLYSSGANINGVRVSASFNKRREKDCVENNRVAKENRFESFLLKAFGEIPILVPGMDPYIVAARGAIMPLNWFYDLYQQGFLLGHDKAIIITKNELLESGINPDDVLWEPLSIQNNVINIDLALGLIGPDNGVTFLERKIIAFNIYKAVMKTELDKRFGTMTLKHK